MAQSPGWLLRVQQDGLVAQCFDAATGKLSGDVLAQPVGLFTTRSRGAFSVSGPGLIAWRTGSTPARHLEWFSRAGVSAGEFEFPA